ncbi:Hsp20/alpha crystallin family protein [Pleurocapsales cyanobacterium LEGE 06147]|nr:Hsp20/alpha crystallin family protein [Pleurocapsales cyanobacterium LEGE 06147]
MMMMRWQPFERMERLQRQIDRIFDDITDTSIERETFWRPAIELIDTPDNLLLNVQLPGVDRNNIDIQVMRDAVLISGEYPYPQQSETNNWLHSEFAYGKFRRSIALPIPVENERVSAQFQNGILTLTLPKTEQARRRVVKLNLGELADSASTATLDAASERVPNGNAHAS